VTYVGRRRDRKDLTHIGPAVERFLATRPASPLDAVLAVWPAVVSPQVAALTEPVRLDPEASLLVVRVESAALASELRFAAEATTRALREALGDRAPASVRYVTGSVPR
jgi:hypothetical protein